MRNKPISANTVLLVCFFIFSWFAVFDIAIMNGDDVVHHAAALQNALVPKLHPSWTPNRVIDIYGRTLFSAISSFAFYSINSIGSISFFILYKLLSASFFAAFTTWFLAYLLKRIPAIDNNKTLRIVFSLTLALIVFVTFYWRNQVHFICYQVPACLTFVLLQMTYDSQHKNPSPATLSGLAVLSYLCAFSLESLSLIILAFNFLLLTIEFRVQAGWQACKMIARVKHALYPKLLLTNIILSATSILIALLFSERSKGAAHADYLAGIKAFFGSSIMPLGIGLILLAIWLLFLKSPGKSTDDVSLADQLRFPAYLGATTLAVTYLISAKTNTNYFSLTSYPWGDLMLIGKISVLYLLALVLARAALRQTRQQAVFALVLVIVLSRLISVSLSKIESDSIFSAQVQEVYRAMPSQTSATIVTGLQLDTIPMEVRPLPTANSPVWFIDAYRTVFSKFYGVKNMPEFQ